MLAAPPSGRIPDAAASWTSVRAWRDRQDGRTHPGCRSHRDHHGRRGRHLRAGRQRWADHRTPPRPGAPPGRPRPPAPAPRRPAGAGTVAGAAEAGGCGLGHHRGIRTRHSGHAATGPRHPVPAGTRTARTVSEGGALATGPGLSGAFGPGTLHAHALTRSERVVARTRCPRLTGPLTGKTAGATGSGHRPRAWAFSARTGSVGLGRTGRRSRGSRSLSPGTRRRGRGRGGVRAGRSSHRRRGRRRDASVGRLLDNDRRRGGSRVCRHRCDRCRWDPARARSRRSRTRSGGGRGRGGHGRCGGRRGCCGLGLGRRRRLRSGRGGFGGLRLCGRSLLLEPPNDRSLDGRRG